MLKGSPLLGRDTVKKISPDPILPKRGIVPPFGILFLSLDRQREVRRDFTRLFQTAELLRILNLELKWFVRGL
jgi:hypothetical protein